MPDEEKDIKIIPRVKNPVLSSEEGRCICKDKFILFGIIFGGFLIMLTVITFLPLSFPLKLAGVLIGSFLLVDLHKTLKV